MPPFRRSAQTRKQAETEVTGDTDKADGSSRAHSSEVHDAEIPSQTCEVRFQNVVELLPADLKADFCRYKVERQKE
jgi:hypothetical protein